MADEDRLADLPDAVAQRARDLREYGLPLTLAVGRAARSLDTPSTEWGFSEVAEAFGVTEDTLKSYASKASDHIQDAERLFVAEQGGSAHILAESSKVMRNGSVFIVSELGYPIDQTYEEAAAGEGRVSVITVEVGGPSGEPSCNRRVTTETFPSLDDLADAKYREADRSAEKYRFWRDLLVEAGVDEDTLAAPGEKLPASHPDSADHLQHQMRSLEPREDRRPPRR